MGENFHSHNVGKTFAVLLLTRMKTFCVYIGTQNGG